MPKFQFLVEVETSDVRLDARKRQALEICSALQDRFTTAEVFLIPRGVPEKVRVTYNPKKTVAQQIDDPS